MLFNSFEFIVFLPIVFLLYWFAFSRLRWQNLFLVIVSYVFYGWWDWRFLLLIAFTSLGSFISGLLMEHYDTKRREQKVICWGNVMLNLLVLGIFKYYNFFVENLNVLFYQIGFHVDQVTIDLILPVGISFYTFQALSYTIDVYKKKLPVTHDAVEFFAYISFFPQLVAGPIERATHLLPQFQRKRQFEYAKAVDGMRQMLWGFFKKMVIADNCATCVDKVWNTFPDEAGSTLLIVAILFAIQIYCDFSGYSDIAIGCARLFGFNLMRNFDYPYFARSIPEFWRRWHISLTTWFRDYIYIPLGGSRCPKGVFMRNVLIVWITSGLWHGANWTFVCWGLYHSILIILYNLIGFNTKRKQVVAYGQFLPSIKELGQMGITFLLVVVGWILFRAESMQQAIEYINAMGTNPFCKNVLSSIDMMAYKRLLICLVFLLIEWMQRDKHHALQFPNCWPFYWQLVRYLVYIVIVISIILLMGEVQTFIYYQF